MMQSNNIDKLIKVNNKELVAILKPNGFFVIDWQETDFQSTDLQIQALEKLYKDFQFDEIDALLYLGLSQKRISLSESFSFVKGIASIFVKKLLLRPDLEFVRDRIILNIQEDEIEKLLQKAPYLIGFEHLNGIWIKKVWKELNLMFCKKIRTYNGSVDSFIGSINPSIHLIGRVFFHLTESFNYDYPFTFSATYSAYISENGKAR